MSKVITVLGHRRPEYTKQVMEALARCNRVNEYTILCVVDGHNEDVRKVFWDANVLFANKNYGVAHTNPGGAIGVNFATFITINTGFQHGDRIIHFEDDVVPAEDCLEYFEWAFDKYEEVANVKTLSAYNRNVSTDGVDPYGVVRENHFTAWGVGYWKFKWEDSLAPAWTPHQYHANTWDTWLHEQSFLPKGWEQVKPILGRVQNIGAKDGTCVPSEAFHAAHHYSPIWAQNFTGRPIPSRDLSWRELSKTEFFEYQKAQANSLQKPLTRLGNGV